MELAGLAILQMGLVFSTSLLPNIAKRLFVSLKGSRLDGILPEDELTPAFQRTDISLLF